MDKIDIFADLILSVHNLYLWTYNSYGLQIQSNCPNENDYSFLITADHLAAIFAFAEEHRRPSVFSSTLHTSWIIDSLKKGDGSVDSVFVLGPFYTDSYPDGYISENLDSMDLTIREKHSRLETLKGVPVIAFTKILEYTVMMHYAITGEKIYIHDLHFRSAENYSILEPDPQIHGTYEAEKEMLRMVRDGDIRIVDQLRKMSSMANVGKLANDNSEPLRQLKNTVLVNIVLFSRAAIDGGLYAETALTLTDHYFQAIEAANTFQEITDITFAMQNDFVNRVHKIRTGSYSHTIQSAIDYILLNIESVISIDDLAKRQGYSKYYLSRMFKKETGSTFKEFIRDKRLERAEVLLANDSISINEISERLQFSSSSYFIESFKEKYGMTPNEFRNMK